MILGDAIRAKLLGSIAGKRLVLLCGAGLSIPSPSNLLAAVRVARECYDKYSPIKVLPTPLRDDVDQLAGYFYGKGEFVNVFIKTLVPWNDLVGVPNSGHAAVGDLLVSRGAKAALSANFDTLIEQWSAANKIAMRGALDDQEAEDFSTLSSPLLKFHGCLNRGREETLWTQAQLAHALVAHRIQRCTLWMNLKLPGTHLLVVGFWSDWGYLNGVLNGVIAAGGFQAVTVIDPQPSAELQAKAPTLWTTLTSVGSGFKHIQASGDEALDELRAEYSKVWLRRYFALGQASLASLGKTVSNTDIEAALSSLNSSELYDCRRDGEGVPFDRAACLPEPSSNAEQAALANLLLINAKAKRNGPWFTRSGKTIRVVQSAGRALASVKSSYREPSSVRPADVIVCAGAIDFGVPGRIVPSGIGASVVRPAPGGAANWLTLDAAISQLGL
jgi:hypothetical protein